MSLYATPGASQALMQPIFPVILCGGVGARLWPLSREQHPKPFLRLSDGQSLLQKALLRCMQLPGARTSYIVTNRSLRLKVEDDWKELAGTTPPLHFILEPCPRNTAPAVAVAAAQIARQHGEDAIMLVQAADHIITNQQAFAEAVATAMTLAQTGKLVTFGIHPTAPETGYGYIETQGSKVIRFVEKPSEEKARAYLENGNFLWNAGIFCFTAGNLLSEMRQHCPDILEDAIRCIPIQSESPVVLELDATKFSHVREQSLDYALMEKSHEVAVVPCNIGWSDIGSWNALGDLQPGDANNNRLHGHILAHQISNCTVCAESRVVGAVGVKDLVIVDTADALLIAHKSQTQEVKQIFNQLKSQDHEAHKYHRCVRRPWGIYTVLEEGIGFKIKRIEVNPGESLSLQMHYHRSEHWVVVAGMAQVVNGDKQFLVNTNESTYIPAGQIHRLSNPGKIPLIIIEVQSGHYLDEDDIHRVDDRYGRHT
ncbi:Alginate biosynthesis protein AlgA [uncultured Comamonas sp.]|nr:Alginate biosynthesis protein AlgA [uncultured Comamonas sp.]